MINTISMANMRAKNQSIPVAGKKEVTFAGLWGEKESFTKYNYDNPVAPADTMYETSHHYYPFKNETEESINATIKKHKGCTLEPDFSVMDTNYCTQHKTLPFTEKEYDAFAKNPKSLDKTKHKLIHETTKDLYVDANNTMSVHDKIKSLNIAAKPAAVKTATETKVVKPLTVEERLGNLEESMKGIKEGFAKFMDDIAPVIKKLGKDSTK